MVPSPLCIFASSVCKSLLCLISTLTEGGKDGRLFRVTCSVVLCGGRDSVNKFHRYLWGVFAVSGPCWVCPSLRQCVLPRSTMPRLHGALQGHSPKWALHFMHFPGLSRSGSRVLHKGTDWVGLCVLCPPQVRAAQATRCLVSALSRVGRVS